MCAATILVGRGSPELQQVRLLVRFSLKRLRFSLCTHTYVLLYSDTILSNSGERMHRDRIPPQRMHAACRIVTRGSCCTKRFAEFNGNCESFCSLEQLVASLCAADEGKSASGTCTDHPVGRTVITLHKPPVPHDPRAGSVQEVVHGRRVMYCPRI